MNNNFTALAAVGPADLIDTNSHVGYVYSTNFRNALVLTNDAWKKSVNGIPHNSFLLASAITKENANEIDEFYHEVMLLRVLEPAQMPSEQEMIKANIEHRQRLVTLANDLTAEFTSKDDMDPITKGETQWGAIKCRILGTFYHSDNGDLVLGSDLENYTASSLGIKVYKPRGNILEKIINHINPDSKNKMKEDARKSGFENVPEPIIVGDIRYTSTSRLQQKETKAKVEIQPSDFLARRTAVLGMTRTGKSNTIKTIISAVAISALKGEVKVGQIIFDINGEYANANHQDDGSSIAEVFSNDCVRYSVMDIEGFKDLRTNFYKETAIGLNIIQSLFNADKSPYGGQDLDIFMSATLEEPEESTSEYIRWKWLNSIFQCILNEAGYISDTTLKIPIPCSQNMLKQLRSFKQFTETLTNMFGNTDESIFSGKKFLDVSKEQAKQWFDFIRNTNIELKKQQKENNKIEIGLESSTKGNSLIDPNIECFLNMLFRRNNSNNTIGGFRAIAKYSIYHTNKRSEDVNKEIFSFLQDGKIVILDLSSGPVEIRTILAERIARYIFNNSMDIMHNNQMPPNIVMFVEEAHNLIGQKEPLDSTWPRIAKEGAKAKIAFVYATQEPSSIHKNILANTENWLVTHLNNEDELRTLGKFYDFADFSESLKTAQDVGFARIKTLSSPFVIPVQIKRFTPDEIKEELANTRK